MKYADARIAFSPPAEWGGPSLVTFAAPGPRAPSFVVAYDELAPGATLTTQMQQHIAKLRETNPEVRVSAIRYRRVGGRTASQMTARWWSTGGILEQTSIYVAPGPDDPARLTVLVFTAPEGTDPRVLSSILATVSFPGSPPVAEPHILRRAGA